MLQHITSTMQRYIKTETFYLRPCDKIVHTIKSIGDEQGYTTSVKASVTDWNLEIPQLEDYLHVLYPKHTIKELWGCTYRQGEFAQTHNHSGFDFSFVWFVDTCSHCSPLFFPEPDHTCMPPLTVHKALRGNLIVFDAHDIHYVPPQSCNHERLVVSGNMSINNEGDYSNETQPWD